MRQHPKIAGNSPTDQLNRAYFAGLSDVVLTLWTGMFGFNGEVKMGQARKLAGERMAANGEKVTQADLTGMAPDAWIAALIAGGYEKFSYVGEKPEDYTTMRPGDHDPTGVIPDYDGTTHTGLVSANPADWPPYTGPNTTVDYVGLRANAEGQYNVINGAENVFNKGDHFNQDGVEYEFLGKIGQNPPMYYWQILGKA